MKIYFIFLFYQLCHNILSGWQRVFLDDRKVPIMTKGLLFKRLFYIEIDALFLGDELIGYDDLQSIELKVRKKKFN